MDEQLNIISELLDMKITDIESARAAIGQAVHAGIITRGEAVPLMFYVRDEKYCDFAGLFEG